MKNKITCPVCKGEGTINKFSIPKEDYEKGLKGYDLYSCNKINGIYGCENCKGSGVKYEDWYILENPELKENNSTLIQGAGYIDDEQ